MILWGPETLRAKFLSSCQLFGYFLQIAQLNERKVGIYDQESRLRTTFIF